MGRPSKRAQFVHGMRAYSAHNCSHVNAPMLCRLAQSYIIGGNYVGKSPWRRTAALASRSTPRLREIRARLACKVVNKQETGEADMSGEKFVRRERGAKDIGLREMAK